MGIGAEGARTPARELFSRRAVKEGRTVVSLRGVQTAGRCRIEVGVFPTTGVGLDAVPLGPYDFPGLDEAIDFVEEALLAFEYLGCSVHSGAEERTLRAVPDAS